MSTTNAKPVETLSKKEIEKLLTAHLETWARPRLANGYQLPSHLRPADREGRRLGAANNASTGWFYTYVTPKSAQCAATPPIATGVLTNTCLVDVKGNDSSVFITCDQNGFTIQAFNNTMCNPNIPRYQIITAPLGCHQQTENNAPQSYQYGCANSSFSSPYSPFPLPNGANYATFSFYDDNVCERSLSYMGVLNGQCLPAEKGASVRISYPNVQIFALANCVGPSTTVIDYFDTSCVVNDDQFFDGDGSNPNNDDFLSLTFGYREAGLFGNGPTPVPVPMPTPSPAQKGWVYSFVSPGEECLSTAPFARGYATNACMTAGAQSFTFSCSSSGITKSLFNSINCDPNTFITTTAVPTGCHEQFDYNLNVQVSIQYQCQSGDKGPVLPGREQYATYEYYDDDECSALMYYSSIVNNECISLGGKSLLVEYPNQRLFPFSQNCTGANNTHLAYIQSCTSGYFGTVLGPQGRERMMLAASLDDVVMPSFTYKSSSLIAGSSPSSASSSSSAALSGGAIAGIAIGTIAALAALVAVVYFVVFGATKAAATPSAPAMEMHDNPTTDKEKILQQSSSSSSGSNNV